MTRIPPAVVAIAGPIGSGKTTTARLLSQQTGWWSTSYGDTVRAAATAAGIPGDRHQSRRVGARLIASGWETFARQVLDQVAWKRGDAVIVEGIRHAEALTALRQATRAVSSQLIWRFCSRSGGMCGGFAFDLARRQVRAGPPQALAHATAPSPGLQMTPDSRKPPHQMKDPER